MEISSHAFEKGQEIPTKFTCEGEDVSPALHIESIPEGTVSLAIIVEDPDAPGGTFDHWVAWNITPAKDLAEGAKLSEQGKNGFGSIGYRGPCPPPGKPHRYFFRIYALDTKLNLPPKSPKGSLQKAMQGHVLAEAEIMGKYQRS